MSHKKTEQWNRDGGRFIPYAATWLNGRRWEDDVEGVQGQAPSESEEDIAARVEADRKARRVKYGPNAGERDEDSE